MQGVDFVSACQANGLRDLLGQAAHLNSSITTLNGTGICTFCAACLIGLIVY
jgi:hypothetical protein